MQTKGLPMKRGWSSLILLCLLLAVPVSAREEKGGGDAPREGATGVIEGRIASKDGARITVRNERETLTLMPYWHGGLPKDGGGLDQGMVEKLKAFKVGDRVKAEWTFQEHYRIDSIVKLGGGDRSDGRRSAPETLRPGGGDKGHEAPERRGGERDR